ncbi:MAG: patatin-like phospholipase family protein [Pseudobdellovibrionaceae bacterium]
MNTLNREFNPHITPVDEDVLRPRFALGLQGGGSWGAWTAGVIKVLIPALCARGTITAVSGTSAGAMNGAALVAGLNTDGPYDGVRRVEELWNNVKGYGQLFGIHPSLTQIFADSASPWPNLPKTYFNMAAAFGAISPVPLIGGTTHILSNILRKVVPDISAVQKGETKLFTNTVRTHIFTGASDHVVHTGRNLTWDSIACSAALKEIGAHVIRDRADLLAQYSEMFYIYHDGAYKINPAITPLLDTNPTDLIVISLHSPKSAEQALATRDKLYQGEIHMDMATLTLDDGARLNVHLIDMDAPDSWDNTSRLNSSPAFIDLLMKQGEAFAHEWLASNGDSLGVQSSHRPRQETLNRLAEIGVRY